MQVKIQSTPSLLAFEPRRLRSDDAPIQDQGEQLRLENPAFARTIDVAQIGHFGLSAWTGLLHSPIGRFGSGAVAVGAGVWGVNKLINGETVLDRVEGVGNLGMAWSQAISAGGDHSPKGSTAAGLVQGGADLITGGADTLRGCREHDKRRLTVGLCQMAIGASVGTSACVPALSGWCTAVMCAAGAARQLAIGFHLSLPKEATP